MFAGTFFKLLPATCKKTLPKHVCSRCEGMFECCVALDRISIYFIKFPSPTSGISS